MRSSARAAGLVGVALLLAGCGPSVDGGWTEDGGEAGYVSGDESVTTWPADDREGPVEVAGTDYSGAAIDIAQWRGDVVVLNTWYAECPPCRAEAPDLVAIAGDYADQGVRLLGINTTDDAGAAQAFERTFAVPYPSLDDAQSHAVASLSGVVPLRAVPTTVVLDREGDVAARILGKADGSTLRALIDDLLAEPA
ncbi:TlpA disulfide reductase family protein [Actinotalea sp. JY-7876]|uniref:TlpA family protein disulfide reductase n=1 Tax=Actinotalea sp. JY-7876 TaxID=2758442 RepID=UPI0015F5A730|nr:TlpA disulfide reductase family protein [Actinotalea sp. JY-7876]